jgi:DNA-binding NtrC family response regulator
MTNKPKILIVDDESEWREELVALLSSADYDIEVAQSFESAREKLRSTRYAVIIVDLELEVDEGPRTFEGFGLLSGIQFLQSFPVGQGKAIVLSAYGTPELVKQAFKRGVYDFLFKQEIDRDELVRIVQEAVDLWVARPIETPERQLSPEEGNQFDRLVHQFVQAKGVQSPRDLTPKEQLEFLDLIRRFMRGEAITFDVPEGAINPWSRETSPGEQAN